MLIALLVVHGLIHLMGFAKAFGHAGISQLKQTVSLPAGVAWLAACMAFLAAGALLVMRSGSWCLAAWTAIAISQVLILAAALVQIPSRAQFGNGRRLDRTRLRSRSQRGSPDLRHRRPRPA